MKIQAWLESATRDADRRGLADLRPLLEALARAATVLRGANWNADAAVESDNPHTTDVR